MPFWMKHRFCQGPRNGRIASSLETENSHWGLKPENLEDERAIRSQCINFCHRYDALLHPCIVFVENQFLLYQMLSFFPDQEWTTPNNLSKSQPLWYAYAMASTISISISISDRPMLNRLPIFYTPIPWCSPQSICQACQ